MNLHPSTVGQQYPYIGSAIVFEASWDITGALRIRFNDPKLSADIVSPTFKLEADGVHTAIYGHEMIYPYGARLTALNLNDSMIAELIDRIAAEKLQTSCPPGQPGVGVRIF